MTITLQAILNEIQELIRDWNVKKIDKEDVFLPLLTDLSKKLTEELKNPQQPPVDESKDKEV